MFQFVINVRSSRHTWVPGDHKQIRTMECQNGEKVGEYCKVLNVTTSFRLVTVLFLNIVSNRPSVMGLVTTYFWTWPVSVSKYL